MAKWGIKGVILGTGQEYVDEWVHRYQAANQRTGRDLALGEGLCIGLWAMVGDSAAAARLQLEPLFEEHVKFAAPLGMLRYSDQQIAATGPGGVARHIAAGSNFQDVIDNRAWFAGSPEDTVTYLEELQDKYPGLEQVMIAFPTGATTGQFRDQMRRFAAEVIPHFKGTIGKPSVTR